MFNEKDIEGVIHPHDDALVVTLQVVNFVTRRILIDYDNFANILFLDAFIKIGINPDHLHSAPMPLNEFSRDVVQPIRVITLSVLARKAPTTSMTMIDFCYGKDIVLIQYNIGVTNAE